MWRFLFVFTNLEPTDTRRGLVWASCWAARVDRMPSEQLSSPQLENPVSNFVSVSPGSSEESPEGRETWPMRLIALGPKQPECPTQINCGIACCPYLNSSLHFFQDLRGCRSHLLSAHLGIHRSTMSKSRTPVLAFSTQHHQLCCPRLCPNTIIEPE